MITPRFLYAQLLYDRPLPLLLPIQSVTLAALCVNAAGLSDDLVSNKVLQEFWDFDWHEGGLYDVSAGQCYKCNFPMNPHVRGLVGPLVCLSVGRLICRWAVYHNLLKWREVTLPCYHWSARDCDS